MNDEVVEEQARGLHAEQTADKQPVKMEDQKTNCYNSPANCGSTPEQYNVLHLMWWVNRRKWRLTDTEVSLWRDPDDVSHCRILSPDKTEWRLILATLCGWRRCFMAVQLWLMTHMREEEEVPDETELEMVNAGASDVTDVPTVTVHCQCRHQDCRHSHMGHDVCRLMLMLMSQHLCITQAL